jgi:hypothetical protein
MLADRSPGRADPQPQGSFVAALKLQRWGLSANRADRRDTILSAYVAKLPRAPAARVKRQVPPQLIVQEPSRARPRREQAGCHSRAHVWWRRADVPSNGSWNKQRCDTRNHGDVRSHLEQRLSVLTPSCTPYNASVLTPINPTPGTMMSSVRVGKGARWNLRRGFACMLSQRE